MTSSHELLELAMQLPAKERAAIAMQLLLSLDEPVDDDCEAAWEAEIAARVRRLHDGSTQTRDWRSSLQALREKIASGSEP